MDELLEEINSSIKLQSASGKRVTVEVRGSKLSLRGTLPRRDNLGSKQQRIPLRLPFTEQGLTKAKMIALEVSDELSSGTFSWKSFDEAHYDLSHPFWRGVDIRGSKECWLWLGKTNGYGYGICNPPGKGQKTINAHRFALKLTSKHFVESTKLPVCHRCDNPACCNPAHLYQGTQQENMVDASIRSRCSGLTHIEQKVAMRLLAHGVKSNIVAESFGVDLSVVKDLAA